ncbi:hypothetical protein JKP88DRAFT_180374, partial [Tribonema minus]
MPCRTTTSEIWYLRKLLHYRPARSYEDLRTVDGHQYNTFREAAVALGIATADKEAIACLKEQSEHQTGVALRRLFVILALQGAEGQPMWDECVDELIEDLKPPHGTNVAITMALKHIQQMLYAHGRCLADIGMDNIHDGTTELDRLLNQWDTDELQRFVSDNVDVLTDEQRTAYDAVVDSVQQTSGRLIMLDAPGGTGKTFTTTLILAKLR